MNSCVREDGAIESLWLEAWYSGEGDRGWGCGGTIQGAEALWVPFAKWRWTSRSDSLIYIMIYMVEFLMGSGQLGLGEHFQPFPNLYDVCNQISKEEYLTASSLSWG